MKNINELLSEFQRLDVKLWINGGKLCYSAPKETLTSDLLTQLRERKPEIIKFLQNTDSASSSMGKAIVPVSRDMNLPLSFAQQRMWFLNQIEGENAAYHLAGTIKITGAIQVNVLKQSFREIIQRHEALRTTFKNFDGQPIQVISSTVTFTLPLVDLRRIPSKEQEAEAQRLVIEEAQRLFDLVQGPLLRVTLLQLGDTEYLLLLVMHHIVSDGWSIGRVLFHELNQLYQAFSQSQASPLPELPIQYPDFAVWQRQYLQGEVLDKELSYWKQQLDGAPTLLQLPTDRPRSPVQTFRGATQLFILPNTLTEALKALSQQTQSTLFMTLLAAFNTLLYRYTGADDILVGSPIANRNQTEIESLIGCFVNTLVLRTDLSGNPSFRDLLKRVREITLNAYAHQNLPFEKLLEELQIARNLSHSPLFQVMFVLQNFPITNLELPGVNWSPSERVDTKTSQFDLTLDLIDTPSGLAGRAEYNTDLFDDSTITRMLGHFQTLLEGLVANPNQRLSDLPLLTSAEQHQLWKEWNQTAADYPKQACIHQLFEAQVERTPDAVAVVFEDEKLTYQQLNQRANQLAHYLKTLGVKPEALVGICVERSIEMVVGLLGILKAGGAYVPLDPAYPQQRLALMVSDAQIPVLLTQKRLLSKLPSHQARVVCLDSDGHSISQESPDNPASSTTPENLAYVIYTSGSTGKPKGVQIPHGGVVNFLTSMQRQPGLTPTDVLLAVTSISFDIAALELYLPLITGARVVLVSREVASDGKQLIEQLDFFGATVMQATPATWQMLLAAGWDGSSQLKILCGGEALPRDLAEQLLARGAAVWNLYGPTETTIWSTVCQVEAAQLVKATVPIGRALANTQVYLLDSWGQPVPIGIPGELHIGGAGLARGYLNRPELTEQKFIHHPVAGRLYKTGDLARYLADGTIEYIERIDHQVKLRGFRIELGEIESLLRQHPAVEQAVVILREDEPGNPRLVSYLVPKRHYHAHTPETESYADEQLSQWEQIWSNTYSQPSSEQDPTLNIIGWNDSYNNLPIPKEEMREWVDCTVKQILSQHPNRVLEIGCGTGMMLFQIAPHCSYYLGTDISQQALDSIEHQKRKLDSDWPQVKLCQKQAHDFDAIAPETFDALIINSVVQYFPNIGYLVDVLEKAVQAVTPRGFIYVGDVRSLPLLESFHADIQLHRAPASLSIQKLQQRVQKKIKEEQELVIDPAFFTALKQHLPSISQVQIQLKRGRYQNELTRFRYDVILYVETQFSSAIKPQYLQWKWKENDDKLLRIRQFLAEEKPDLLFLKNVPNPRIQTQIKIVERLKNPEGLATVGDLREALRETIQEEGIDPEDWYALSDEFPYVIYITWSDNGAISCYDVAFHRRSPALKSNQLSSIFEQTNQVKYWSVYANNPLQGKLIRQQLIPQLRSFLQKTLPSYMNPSVFVTLDALPLTPNGKVDRRALPAPEMGRTSLEEAVVLPRNPVEEVLAGIWCQLLGVEAVGIERDFFELGGHSLLATQVISRIEKAFGVELPVRCLFESPTLAELATSVQQLMQSQSERPVPPIERVSRDGVLPLSFSQYRLWLLEQLQPGTIAYNMATALHLLGSLNVAALEQALNEIVRRHEALRTTFCVVEGQPVQVIAPSLTMKLSVRNLSEVPEAQRGQKVQQLVTQWSQQLFDLTQGLLLRSLLLQLDQQEHLLVLSVHHIVADGWSAGVFFRELTTLYHAFSQGQPSPLPELPIQYADFAIWQRQWLQGDVLETQLTYWKRQLGTIPPVLKLSSDRSSTPSSTGKKQSFALSSTLTEAAKALSQREGVTLFMILLAAFKTLLYRYSGQEDIAVGSPIANRNRRETEELIGFFVNTLVLRTNLSGNPSFREVLRRVREVALGAYAHQDLPFEKLVAELQPERNLGHNPLFQVWFVLQNAPMPTVELPGLKLNLLDVETGVARYDLKLDLTEIPEGLTGFFEYKTDLFEASEIARMTQLYETLLETLIEQPDIQLNALLEVLENAEKQQQLAQEEEFKTARRQKLGNIRRKQVKS